jgi:hypothetical protein
MFPERGQRMHGSESDVMAPLSLSRLPSPDVSLGPKTVLVESVAFLERPRWAKRADSGALRNLPCPWGKRTLTLDPVEIQSSRRWVLLFDPQGRR